MNIAKALFLLICYTPVIFTQVLAQTSELANPSFEVASIKAEDPWRMGVRTVPVSSDAIPPAEFVQIIQNCSEKGGSFADNFVSNESRYLMVSDVLQKFASAGDAYVGVGPEQNFTYIAKLRPRIAFIVDIRRQAVLQHLMYKAIFHASKDRANFLSLLLSRPLEGSGAPGTDASISDLIAYFGHHTPADDHQFAQNLAEIGRVIQEEFQFPLSARDDSMLKRVYGAFRKRGLNIAFNGGGRTRLKDLMELPGPDGRPGSFLASGEDFNFVRDLQLRNRIIPVVGNLAGNKALKCVGSYLRANSYFLTAFYTSNVEDILMQDGDFKEFVENVRSLPITPNSLFIRSVLRTNGKPLTLLQLISVFMDHYGKGAIRDYNDLLLTNVPEDLKRGR